MSRCRESKGASLGSQITPPAESSSGNDCDSMHRRRKSSSVASRRTSPSRTNGEPYTAPNTMSSPPMCTLLAGLRACTSNSRGASATWASTKSGSRYTTSPSVRWPAFRNSSTASGLANWTPISDTIRRQPLSSTATASGGRISYLGIVLRNIGSPEWQARNGTFLTGASHRKTMFRDMEQSSPTGTQAVDRAAQLLIQVARHRDPVTFTELTSASGLAKSTTSRLLTALERNGLVRRDPAGRFSPGEVFVSYACRGGVEADLVSLAQPVLARLGEQTGETVNLGVPRDGGLVEQIAQVDSRYLIGGTNWVGLAVPLHCAALGKVLLAFGAAELPKGRLEKRTDRTITSRTGLAAEPAAVRERGYAVTIEDLEPGLVAVAAPVFADGGTA